MLTIEQLKQLALEGEQYFKKVEEPYLLSVGWKPAENNSNYPPETWVMPNGKIYQEKRDPELYKGHTAYVEATYQAMEKDGWLKFTIIRIEAWGMGNVIKKPMTLPHFLHPQDLSLHCSSQAIDSFHKNRPLGKDDDLGRDVPLYRELFQPYDLREYRQAVVFDFGPVDWLYLPIREKNSIDWNQRRCLQLRKLFEEDFNRDNFEREWPNYYPKNCNLCKSKVQKI